MNSAAKEGSKVSANQDGAAAAASRQPTLPRLRSTDLLSGAREAIIEHGQEQYRLRLTSNGKLILTK
ncbi:MAG: hemin uptake protein HemP [Reyranellaceae bacterium]